ncbi:hypothetical protein [Nocardioides panacisoli]|uniref:Pyrrolo-quinoline quinone n=1 Tax=Nocardioides panacisoli TaxID=627624 RepID=A0ABP7IYX9_9ACTN
MTRRALLVLAAAAVVTALPTGWGVLTAHDTGPDPAADRPATPAAGHPTQLSDLHWDRAALLGLDTCDSVAVVSEDGRPLVVVDGDHVVVPGVLAPPGSGLEVDGTWTTSGGCVPTARGPVVVVEAQKSYADPSPPGPKVFAGFTPEGRQLWSRREDPGAFGSYAGRGAFVVDGSRDRRWAIVDARTGADVATGTPEEHRPTVPLTPHLVGDEAGGLVEYPDGRPVGDFATAIAQVDDDRMIVSGVQGLELVRLDGLQRIWLRRDLAPSVIWDEVADLSTGTAVLFDFRNRIHGVDLATGTDRWIADVPRSEVNGIELQAGSGVVVFRTSGGAGQVVLDSETGERLHPGGFVLADQHLLLLVRGGTPRPVTVEDLR